MREDVPWRPDSSYPQQVSIEAQTIELLGHPGKMISGSKSRYRDEHPDNLAIFNASVFVGPVRIWSGDLDLTLEQRKLVELAERADEVVSVLFESSVFWSRSPESPLDIEGEAAVRFLPDGTIVPNPQNARLVDGQLSFASF